MNTIVWLPATVACGCCVIFSALPALLLPPNATPALLAAQTTPVIIDTHATPSLLPAQASLPA